MQPTAWMESGRDPQVSSVLWKALLVGGIISSLLYIGADILAAVSWDAYSYTSQGVSELMAIGAPTRPLLVALFGVSNLLVTAFGIGVLGFAGRKHSLRFTGILLALYGAFNEVALLFFPMHTRGTAGTGTDNMHIVATIVCVLFMLLYTGFGAAASGKGFRWYSIVTVPTVLGFGALAGMKGAQLAANLPTPWLGVLERISIYSSLLWLVVFAVVLWPARQRQEV